MRKILLGAFGVAGSLLAFQPPAANAAPQVTVARDSAVVLVDGGCGGPAFYRAPNGYCYRKPYAYAPPPPPPVYYRRACAYGWHPTPWGCRPNY